MEIIDGGIKYVGFINFGNQEYIVGVKGDYFYYGPFIYPKLGYLEEYCIDLARTTTEFEDKVGCNIYHKDLKDECIKIIEQYDKDGESYSRAFSSPIFGEMRFDLTNYVNELKKFIEE